MAFQPAGQTAVTVTRYTGELLPHLLTLTPEEAVIFFFAPMPSQTSVFQQCGTLSCPDFPPQAEACSDRINYCKILKNYAKIVNFADIIEKSWQSHPLSVSRILTMS